jgi:hypothetical protein
MSNSPEAAVAATADTAVTDFIPISTDANKDTEPSSPSILVPALPQMELNEATHNAATTPNATSTNDAVGPTLYVGLCLPREVETSTPLKGGIAISITRELKACHLCRCLLRVLHEVQVPI